MSSDPNQLAQTLVDVCLDAKAENTQLFDLQGQSYLTDFVLIAEGRSQAHVRGIAERLLVTLKREHGIQASGVEGADEGSWVLIDYSDVIVHLFHPEMRKYYQLEELYKDCPSQHFGSDES